MITEKLTELKEKSALTNQQIADLSGVPLSTVTRIFSGQTDNPTISTKRKSRSKERFFILFFIHIVHN